MADVNDVAAAIVQHFGAVDTYKLQKLTYYAQSWHLAWYDKPLFEDEIEAWAQGPVVRTLWEGHRGRHTVTGWEGDPARLSAKETAALDAVLARYGDLSGRELSQRAHRAAPWISARHGLRPGERSAEIIPKHELREYYEVTGDDEDVEPDPELAKQLISLIVEDD